MRKVIFQNEEYYHIYNRGVDKRKIFLDERDFIRFLRGMKEFNNESTRNQRDFVKRVGKDQELSSEYSELSSYLAKLPKLVEIICYCLNPNHYHFILKQLVEEGVPKFMHKIGLGFTNYFNEKYNRSGSLFQGTFKAAHLKIDEQLLWMSGYVNGNSEIHRIAKPRITNGVVIKII